MAESAFPVPKNQATINVTLQTTNPTPQRDNRTTSSASKRQAPEAWSFVSPPPLPTLETTSLTPFF
jgi:hypothetical protein